MSRRANIPAQHGHHHVRMFTLAAELAAEYGHEFVTVDHLIRVLVDEPDVAKALGDLKIDTDGIREALDEMFQTSEGIPVTHTTPQPTQHVNWVAVNAAKMELFHGEITPVAMLVIIMGLPPDDLWGVTLLHNLGLTSLALKRYLSHGDRTNGAQGRAMRPMEDGGMGQAQPEITNVDEAREFLKDYTRNLNEAAKELQIDPLIGRAEEVEETVHTLSRRTKNNVIYVGDPGVGKTALAEGLALRIVRGEVPEVIKDCTVYALDVSHVVAGTKFRGEMEERVKQILKALGMLDNIILFIDEIHTMMGAGSANQSSLDMANLLKPALAKGKLHCIGTTTSEEYRKYFEKDRALMRRFRRINIDEPSVEDAKLILRGLSSYYEDFHGVKYQPDAIDAAVDLTARYVTNAYLPDKAIDIIDQAGSRQRIRPADERKAVIGVAEIEFEVGRVSKIPAQVIQEDEVDKMQHLERDLRAAVFGQDPALAALTDAVLISRAGLRDTNKPAGAFLFVGPTGVGKTEAARQLAATLGVKLVKFDMSEYMEKHSVAKLIGAPPGYVGYGEGGAGNGLLTNEIESHPHCVLLLDEIEKAHPDVFNILLQAMDDGRMTNSGGKTVSFRNVLIIMTSNAGARELQAHNIGFARGLDDRDGEDEAAINKAFSPEFRNRLDAIIRFNALKPADMHRVVDKFVAEMAKMAAHRGVTVTLTNPARHWLAEKGYDKQMGARPMARVINEHIKKPLSRMMILGALKNGGTVTFRLEGDALAADVAGK